MGWVSIMHCSRRARCMSGHSVKFHRIPSSRDALELRYQEFVYCMHESNCIDSYGGSCVGGPLSGHKVWINSDLRKQVKVCESEPRRSRFFRTILWSASCCFMCKFACMRK